MTRHRFFLALCLTAAVVVGSLAIAANPGSEGNPSIENSLAVQRAVLQARDHLVRGEPKKAIDVLEANVAVINGDRRYLMLMRDAYREYIKDLALANQPAVAEVYKRRLKILDDETPAQTPNSPPQVSTSSAKEPSAPPQVAGPQPKVPVAPASSTGVIVRAKPDDPFDAANQLKPSGSLTTGLTAGQSLLAKADAEYVQKRYADAKLLYEQAFQANEKLLSADSRERWAYCQMQVVVDQVNRFPDQTCNWAKLEDDVKTAVKVAPKLTKIGDELLAKMRERRDAGAGQPAPLGTTAVKHHPRGAHGWLTAETANFRIFHNQTPEFAQKVAQIAEYTRSQMTRKWFGKDGDEWTPKCDIMLHATGADYSSVTGVPANSPGHSRIETDPTNGRVVGRRVDVHCDNPAMLEAILPHETTHVVLAGQFGNQPVPRWVDEGIAVLTEPVEKVSLHKKNLSKCLQNRQLIPLRELMQLHDYPPSNQISTFYAQSVALVDYLTKLKGPTVFTQFVRESLRDGYEVALRKHYGLQGFGELQDRWTERMLADLGGAASPAFAERKN
jgi:tetratricopeptide (TPR) repeat protein